MIRDCTQADFETMLDIINEVARAYKGVIPGDCWREPYMPAAELRREIEDGVVFRGYEDAGRLLGIMGGQDKGDVMLIRHAYVRQDGQRRGVGSMLLRYLESRTEKPVLVGTWAAASWAIAFYIRNGYTLLTHEEKDALLAEYWSIPERQIETSVVLARHYGDNTC